MRLELIATATFGLEAVVKREIEQLGYRILKTEDGKVTYMGDERAIVRSNLWLRSADRVLLKMAEFEAREFEELFQRTKALDWEQLVPLDGKFTVTGTSVKSRLHSVPACQKIVKKAIVEKLKEFYDVETFPETGAQYTVKAVSYTHLTEKLINQGVVNCQYYERLHRGAGTGTGPLHRGDRRDGQEHCGQIQSLQIHGAQGYHRAAP